MDLKWSWIKFLKNISFFQIPEHIYMLLGTYTYKLEASWPYPVQFKEVQVIQVIDRYIQMTSLSIRLKINYLLLNLFQTMFIGIVMMTSLIIHPMSKSWMHKCLKRNPWCQNYLLIMSKSLTQEIIPVHLPMPNQPLF